MEIWAILYLACALIYAIYLLAHLYFRRKDQAREEAALLKKSAQGLNLPDDAKSTQSFGASTIGHSTHSLHTNYTNNPQKNINQNINHRLEQINKSIQILEEKILRSGKGRAARAKAAKNTQKSKSKERSIKERSLKERTQGKNSEPSEPTKPEECTTGLDYLRKGLRNRKKQIPKHEKDIKFEQMDKERKQAKQLEEAKIAAASLSNLSRLGVTNEGDTEKVRVLKRTTKLGPRNASSISTSMSSLSTTGTSCSTNSTSKFTPATETTSVDSYDTEKANLTELQSIIRQVGDLKEVSNMYKKSGKW